MGCNYLCEFFQSLFPLAVFIKSGETQTNTMVVLVLGTKHTPGQYADIVAKRLLINIVAICALWQGQPA